MTDTPIIEFRGDYRFLSNFWVEKNGLSVEHWFQAAKTTDPVESTRVLTAKSPGEAKRMGRTLELRSDWDSIKFQVMANYVAKKFTSDAELMDRLLATGARTLVEGNTWGDKVWGVDLRDGEGSNHLGQILMSVRATLGVITR